MLNFLFFTGILKKVDMKKEDYLEAKELSKKLNIPIADALHGILSRDNEAVFISQDKHAQKLREITDLKKPEEVN